MPTLPSTHGFGLVGRQLNFELQAPFGVVGYVITASLVGSVSMAGGANMVSNAGEVLRLKMKSLTHRGYLGRARG